jgi:hypothetical protein
MKKSLLIAAAVMITFGACTNDDSAPVQNEIGFKAINYKNTKAAINSSAYPTDIPFGVFAYYLPTGKNWSSNYADAATYMGNIEVAYDATDVIYKSSTKYYWPNQGSLTFVAYSPKKASTSYDISSRTLTITDYTCEAVEGGDFSDQSDLMYSKAGEAANKTANEKEYNSGSTKGVQIQFRHALSQIRFFAKPKETSTTTQFNVLKVVLKDIQNKGTLTIAEDDIAGAGSGWNVSTESTDKKSFTTYDDATGIVLPKNDATNYTRIGDSNNNLLVIPQEFLTEDCKIEVTYKMWVNGTIDAGVKTKSVSVKDIISKFEPNKIYKMNFSISADEILFAPEIESWDAPVESLNGDLKEQN